MTIKNVLLTTENNSQTKTNQRGVNEKNIYLRFATSTFSIGKHQ